MPTSRPLKKPPQQPEAAGLLQHQHHHQRAHKLLQAAVKVAVQGGKICPGKEQYKGKDQVRYEQAAEEQHLDQDAEQDRVRVAQSFEHEGDLLSDRLIFY